MKVCILSNDDPAAFQSSINAFIADKKVIDIKYQSMNLTLKFTNGVPSESIIVDRALIIYEECADHFNVDRAKVNLTVKIRTEGYGPTEHQFPEVSAVIKEG